MQLAILSGTSITSSTLFEDWVMRTKLTEFGEVTYRKKGRVLVVNRHGAEGKIPPHAINHRANIAAIHQLGCSHILSLNSVGSLCKELPPGTLISCNDYISFFPISFSNTEGHYLAPKVGNGLLEHVQTLLGGELKTGKVYIQTRGPRFETPAEVRMLQGWGDVVGMTMASEADLANEVDVDYTSLAMIDNFANGLGEEDLSYEIFKTRLAGNQSKVNGILGKVIDHYL